MTIFRQTPYVSKRKWDSDANKFWQQENELINHRLTWLGATQSFLFAGTVFSHGFQFDIGESIALFGALTSGAIMIGTAAAVWAQCIIAKNNGGIRCFGISRFTTMMGWFASVLVPFLFVIGWGVLYCSYKDGKFEMDANFNDALFRIEKPLVFSIGDIEVFKISQ